MDAAGTTAVIDELCSFERRLAGTDAERRAASRLAERLRELGRPVEIEPTYVHPQVGLVIAVHCLAGFAGSLVAVAVPELGFALVLVAATSLYLDLNARLYLLRRLLFRRASQNVVSPGAVPDAPARLLITAHYDAARGGAIFGPRAVALLERIARIAPSAASPTRLLFWSLAALVPILGARTAGLDSDALSLIQLLPTLAVLVGLFGAIDNALAEVVPGANDNASGVAAALSVAEVLHRDPPENLDVWIVLTGAEECLMQGMHGFIRTHRTDLDPQSTFVLNIDSVGRGDVRWVVGEGPAVTYDLRSRLTELCAAIAQADAEGEARFAARPLRHGFATDALVARVHGIPATTITCLEDGALVPANHHRLSDVPEAVDIATVGRAADFATLLVGALDRDLGRAAAPNRPPSEEASDAEPRPRASAH